MPIVIPGYLNERSLPYASDIFYHGRLLYLLPTGFHPLEVHSVAEFPEFCRSHGVALPAIIWKMCELYFQNSRAASECLDALEPLRKSFVLAAITSYPRGRAAVDAAKNALTERPEILSAFSSVDLDMRLVARELLSHLLFEVFLENGYRGAIEYVRANTAQHDGLPTLVCAVLLNRLRAIATTPDPVLVYEHSWYPLLQMIMPVSREIADGEGDALLVEHFAYKLFETVLLPLFGRCDTKKRSKRVARVATRLPQAVTALKDECRRIAREVVLVPSTSSVVRQQVLAELVNQRLAKPLAEIVGKPMRDVAQLLRDFTLDSTVIGGLLALTQGASPEVAGLAAAAGALSTGVKYLVNERQRREEPPTALLSEGLRHAAVEETAFQDHLRRISIERLEIPRNWQCSLTSR